MDAVKRLDQLAKVAPLGAQAIVRSGLMNYTSTEVTERILGLPLPTLAVWILNLMIRETYKERSLQISFEESLQPLRPLSSFELAIRSSASLAAWLRAAPEIIDSRPSVFASEFAARATPMIDANIDHIRAAGPEDWPLIYAAHSRHPVLGRATLAQPKTALSQINRYFRNDPRFNIWNRTILSLEIWREICDYIVAAEADGVDFADRGIKRILNDSQQWHHMARERAAEYERISNLRPDEVERTRFPHFELTKFPQFRWQGHNYLVAPLLWAHQLRRETAELGHCVADYPVSCIRGTSFIFSITSTDGGSHRYTLELNARGRVEQMQGAERQTGPDGFSDAAARAVAQASTMRIISAAETYETPQLAARSYPALDI